MTSKIWYDRNFFEKPLCFYCLLNNIADQWKITIWKYNHQIIAGKEKKNNHF